MAHRDDFERLQAAATAQLTRFHKIPASVREELVQEALLRTWHSPGVHHPRAFVCRTAQNLAISWLRRSRHRERPSPVVLEDAADTWVQQIEARMDLERVAAQVRSAPPSYRQMLVCVLDEVSIPTLVRAELGLSEDQAERTAWVQRRDALYKRRRRSLAWLRVRLQNAA